MMLDLPAIPKEILEIAHRGDGGGVMDILGPAQEFLACASFVYDGNTGKVKFTGLSCTVCYMRVRRNNFTSTQPLFPKVTMGVSDTLTIQWERHQFPLQHSS